MKVSLTSPPERDRPSDDDRVWSYPKFAVFRDAQPVFADLALYRGEQFTVTGAEGAERERGERVGARYLTTLGVRPLLGRNLLPEEDRAPEAPRVVMLGEALWQRRFGGDPAALGRTLTVDGQPHTIVGVLPAGFRGLTGRAELWVPVMAHSARELGQAWNHSYTMVARLRPGVAPERAQLVVAQLGARVHGAFPHPENPSAPAWGAAARPLDDTRVDPLVRRSLLVLLGAVGLVLLIACANVANLFLGRAAGRRREIAVRLAIGAGRWRLVRQLLTESVLLGVLGGVASLGVAWWGVKLLAALEPAAALQGQRMGGLGVVAFTSIRLDTTAFAFAAALALGTGLLFGLVPALQATRPSLGDALTERGTLPAPRRFRGVSSRGALAAAEIAIAVVLLAGSGLMLRSLRKLLDVRPGFEAASVLTMRVGTSAGLDVDSLPALRERLVERVAALPGVTDVAVGNCPPLSGGCSSTVIELRDQPPPAAGAEPTVGVYWATPGWFQVLRVPLLRGRLFASEDRPDARRSVIVNETAARTFWPGQDPIGRPVGVGQGGFWDDTAYVVGVVGDVRFETMDSLPRPDVYLPYSQSPSGRMMLFVRTAGDPLALAPAARRALHDAAPGVPVYDVMTMEARVADATAAARFSTVLLTFFGLVALALATVGTYGVIAFATMQRTQEIGIRMALGATRGEVARLVVSEGVAIAAVGGALGIAGALAATRVLRSLLYDVEPSDPVTFAGIVALLALAVIAANWIPARRAARIDPARALRG
jgi:predicted permease